MFKGPRFHTVEFQPWEGGPRTVVEMKVRVSLLRSAHEGATGKNDNLPHAGEDPTPRPPAFSGEAAATALVPSSPSFSRCSSVSQESFSRASLTMTREGALTRKALRDMERSIVMNTSPKGRGSLVKEGGNGVEVQTEDIDSDDMDLDSERDQDEYDGSEKDDEAQGGYERKESSAAIETSTPAKIAGPGVDSKYPMFFPVGARVILKNLGPNKIVPKGPFVDRDDLVGKKVRRRGLERSQNEIGNVF